MNFVQTLYTEYLSNSGCPCMLIKEHCGIENAPFWHYLILIKSIPRNNRKIFVTEYPWLKFEPNLLTWLPNGKIEKTTVYLLFSLFIQFSAIEIGLVFSHVFLLVGELQPFFNSQSDMKANPQCFQYARVQGRAKWRHTEIMRRGDAQCKR